MPETAVYDLVSFDHTGLNRKHFGGVRSSVAMMAPKPTLNRPTNVPKIVYNSADSSDSEEDDKIYESLEQVQLRKSLESANRRAKTSKVKRTGHPLFDSLREERALKENVRRPAKEVVNPYGKNYDRQSDYQNTIQKLKLYADPRNLKKNKKNSENMQEYNYAKTMSLQRLDVHDRHKYQRRISEQPPSQTVPNLLSVQKKALAKSEQNLMSLHPAYQHQQRIHSMMMQSAQVHRQGNGRVSNPNSTNRFYLDSSDSDSDWMAIPRPKISARGPNRNQRSSDDSDTSGHLYR